MKRILILYRELASYFTESLNYFCERHDVAVDLVAYPINVDAPFSLPLSSKIKLLNRNDVSLQFLSRLIRERKYDVVFCGGWSDRTYLRALGEASASRTILGFDNAWGGHFRQRLATLFGKLYLTPKFDFAWVPGERQADFAERLGFNKMQILRGVYTCNTEKFRAIAESRRLRPLSKPAKLVYVGRYAPEKFIRELWRVMLALRQSGFANWELHCVGTGPLWNERLEDDGIVHHGFMQPSQLYEFMKEGDAFILPSSFEPWGVAVHEFAAAGYPLILSDVVGAGESFLKNGENGFCFRAGDCKDLQAKLRSLFSTGDEDLRRMGARSFSLAKNITLDRWAETLYTTMRSD